MARPACIRRSRRHAQLGGSMLAWALFLGAACDKTQGPELPPAEVYEPPPKLDGSWRGEIGGTGGALRVQALDDGRYYGMFEARDAGGRYVINMHRRDAPAPDGKAAPSNLVEFTWQDGRGDRGAGWLLINRDGSALTGTFGHGEGNTDGGGAWTFVRATN